ncbi:DUF3047 domain-containing protein [Vibrio rumoiensis]|uniref:DUF3047 domain-containing protein n=1 Tax=Vibrio rumoiensis 1S-45 TaxID=1188252 RepID=A0A1E5DZQ7_9VIBR|nr:DUF3047 domain-containing protein [Vibrio rumoiensis]OEF23402.1 hypothetical protein A1QC_12055 [Vibrio rumoiensis 1S-45]
MVIRSLICGFSLFVCFSVSATTVINVTDFNQDKIKRWESKSILDETHYNVEEYKNRIALKAVSDHSASGLILKEKIDLLKTPNISWSWLTSNTLPSLDETTKKGDDYVARVYVVIDGGMMMWNTKSLSYVWSSNQSQGQVWDNAFTGSNVQMIAVRGKQAKIQHWYDEKRNVYQDLIQYFGDKGSDKANQKAYRYIDIIAIMTDTDNSGGKVESYYGDIVFSRE